MKKSTTGLLKAAVVIIGLPVLIACGYLLPQLAFEAFGHAKNGATLGYVVLGLLLIMYTAAVPFYMALYQAFTILGLIDRKEAFSSGSVRALRKIKRYAFSISGLYVLSLPLLFVIAEWDDAPGLILIGLVLVGTAMVIGVFAAVLQALLQEAIAYKQENELTV